MRLILLQMDYFDDITSYPGMLGFLLFFLFAYLIIHILFLLTLQNTLKEISPENRFMRPGQVWLSLIPLFGLIWTFLMVGYIADSIRSEYVKRNLASSHDRPTYGIGMAYAILSVCSVIPYLGDLAAFGVIICWIIYWVKVNEHRNHLQQNPYIEGDLLRDDGGEIPNNGVL
jgi:hypothetical protein